jgi:hypothetical protein
MQNTDSENFHLSAWRRIVLAAAWSLFTSSAVATLPPGWGDTDIGSPAIAGSASYTNGVWTVAGGGTDIWNTGDQFNFLTNSLNGDGAIIARVTSQTATDPWAQAGIMLRNGIASNAAQVSLMLTPGNGVSFRYRYTAGGSTYQVNQTGIATPEWIRLSRSTNAFTAAYSADGLNWTQLGTAQTVSMSAPVIAGLAVTAHNNSLISTGALTSVFIVPGAQAGTQTNLINPYIGGLEMAWETTWPLPQLNVVSNALRPRMGWNCYFVVGVNNPGPMESIILQTADALVTNGLAAAGYKYEVIDGSWIATGRGYRAANGDLMVTNTYWPDGMEYVADYVHSKGLFMGGYSDIGSPGYGNPAQIGMYAYYQHDADQFASWGWDFIKIDDHGPGDFYAACDAIVNNSSGRPMGLSLSTPQVDGLQFANRIANSYRVANDISFTMGTVTWSSILAEFDADQARWFAQAPGHWNDPDMLCTGLNGISDVEGRSHMNMWCILGAPLMIGTDVRMSGTPYYAPLLTATTLNTLTNAEVIAIDQDPLGAAGRPVAGGTAIYAKPLGGFSSGQYAVMLLNRSSQSNAFTVNWSDIGLAAGSAATVRDLWAHQNLGTFTNSFTSPSLASHDSMMLAITGVFDWNQPRVYEAESAYNTFSGTVYYVPHNPAFSSGAYVTGIGMGTANTLQFNQVTAPSNGLYKVDIYYASSVARNAQLSVNGGAASTISFPSTGGDTNSPGVIASYIQLGAGQNTLLFSNATAMAPNLDRIVVSRGTPTGLTAVAGDGQVQLSWTAPAGAVSFNLYRGMTSGGEGTTPIATALTMTNYTDTNVVNEQAYFYTVTAMNPVLGGESPPSLEASARPRYATSSLAYAAAVLAASPMAYWRLNETNGNTAYDALGKFNGTYGSNVTLGVAGPQPPAFLGFELTNTAVQFTNNLTNSWMTIPALNLDTNTVTITAWIYPSGNQADFAGLVFYRTGTTVAGLNYGGSGSSSAGTVGYTWNNDQNSWGWNSGLFPPANQWSFVALVIQPSDAVLYLFNTNGVQTATNTYANPNQAFAGSGTIGTDAYSSTARAFNGVMDEVAVFNYCLTSAQVQQFYANGFMLSPIQISLQNAGVNFNLIWPQGTLLQATNVTGPWSRIISGPSPFTVIPTNQTGFYRVLLQ